MPDPEPHHPKVFISYSHDSLEHSDRVRDLSDRLRADGIDCVLDQYEVSPPEGWPRWTDNQIGEAAFVLMICTETYYLRVMGNEEPGKGLGVRWEGNSIYQHIYNEGTLNKRFLPVFFESAQVEHIPTPLQGVAHYACQTEEGYEDLYRRVTGQPKHLKPELGNVRVLGEVRKLEPLAAKERKQNFFTASLTNLPFERNPFFTGREEILIDLHEAFTKKSAGSATQAISGLGGLGKTQTAIEYAYRHRDEYKAVFWVQADTQLALITGFVEIARLVDLPEKDAQNPDDAVRAAIHWTEVNYGWLIIFDNADKPELVKGFRPRNGDVLLTSRAQVFDALGIAKPFEIDVMLPGEALKFLFTRTGRDHSNAAEREAAAQLAEQLGYLPLALEQAGAFITAKKARFKDYLAGYRKRRLELLDESGPVTGDYPESVATTWAMNFGEIEKGSAAASDLLRASALLSPDSIPLELITEGKLELGPALSTALTNVADDPLALNEVLEPLTRYSFIRLDSDLQTYSIHRLVQEVLRDGMDADTQRLWAERIIRALNNTFPSVEFETWPLFERFLPHARAAVGLIEKWDITLAEAARLLNQVATYYHDRGQYANAEPLLNRALAIHEMLLKTEDPALALSLNNLAILYNAQGRYAEAEPLYQRSLAIDEKTFGPNDPNVAADLNNLAELYRAQGKYAEAEGLHLRSLAIKETALGSEDTGVAQSLNNIAVLYMEQGRHSEAEPLLKRALLIREKALGPNHPKVASTLNNLAALYRERSDYALAEPLYRRSLAIKEAALGPEHPSVATTLNSLALFYYNHGNFSEAEPMYKQSLSIYEKALGQDHPSVATVLDNYALLLRATQRDAEAGEIEARAEAIRAKYSQPDSLKSGSKPIVARTSCA